MQENLWELSDRLVGNTSKNEQQKSLKTTETKNGLGIHSSNPRAEFNENEQQIAQIFETTDEGILLADIGGDIIRANAAAIRILRLAPDKLHEQSLHLPYWEIPARWAVLNPDGTPMRFHQNPLANTIINKRTIKNVEFGIKFEDGKITWVNTSTAPFINENNRVEGIVFTFSDITEQKRLRDEKELFTKKLIEAQEEERNRIARELHDDTAQWLALLTIEIDDIIAKGEQAPPEIIARLQKLRGNTDRALQEVRRFSHELRPSVLEQLGLTAALELIVNEFNSVNATPAIKASLNIAGIEKRLSQDIELALFRVAQESLNNIRKHSLATEANIQLRYAVKVVCLMINDNGQGFDIKRPPKLTNLRSGGLGLIGMRERAKMIGGRFILKSIKGKGTSISVKVPFQVKPSGKT